MLDAKFVRDNTDKVKAVIASGRGNPTKADVDKWIVTDQKRAALIGQVNEANAQRNNLAKVGKEGGDIETIRTKAKEIKEKLTLLETELAAVEAEWKELLSWMPNMPVSDDAMPYGKTEDDNPVIKAWLPVTGYINGDLGNAVAEVDYMPFQSLHWDSELTPQHHQELGEALGIIDVKQAALTSGSRFTYLLKDAVLMQYAIQQLMFSELLNRGFTPIIPPLMVKEPVLFGTSHFPEGRDQVYKIQNDNVEDANDLYLVGSSEPSNFAYFMNRTLSKEQLPYKVFAYTSCFRSEVGSWGRDVKGIKRVHQFDKIEMNCVCTPEQSNEIFAELLSVNEWLLQTLEIPYRLARKCTADAGYLASAEQIDPEAWLPGQREFIEVGTDTNTTDYQARRLNIKYTKEDGSKEYAHTLNDTGVAMGRMIIAIMDNYQQADGSVKVPAALVKYMGKEYITKP